MLLPSHGIEFSSPYACMSPKDIKGPGLGFPYQGLVMSQLLFPRLCSTLRLARGKRATSECCKCSEPKGTVSESHCSVSGSNYWGVCGVLQDTRWGQRAQGIPSLGDILGILTPWDTKHLFCGLEKVQKAPFIMVTYFSKDYLTSEGAEPGYEKHRPQSQADWIPALALTGWWPWASHVTFPQLKKIRTAENCFEN